MTRLLIFALLCASILGLGAGAADAQSSGPRVHLINGIPDSTVEVSISGETAIEDFAFRDTEDLTDLAGEDLSDVTFSAPDGSVLLAVGDLDLPPSGSVSILLHLKVDGSPGLTLFDNDLSALEPGQSRLVIRHLAAAPPVDVVAAGQVVFEGLANGGQREADLDAGDVTAELVASGDDGPTIIGPADLSLIEGSALIVYGLGSFEDGTMTVLTELIEGLDSAPTGVDAGNSATGGLTGAPLVALAVVGAGAGLAGLARLTGRAGRSPLA